MRDGRGGDGRGGEEELRWEEDNAILAGRSLCPLSLPRSGPRAASGGARARARDASGLASALPPPSVHRPLMARAAAAEPR